MRRARSLAELLLVQVGLQLIVAGAALSEDAPKTTPPPAASAQAGPPEAPPVARSKVTSDESEQGADRRKLLLATGENKTVDIEFDVSGKDLISIGNPGVVATTAVKIGDQSQIVFTPLKAGETTVTVRRPEGDIGVIFQITVTGTNLSRVRAELLDLLRDIEGLEIRVVGQKVVVDGEVIIPNDYGKLLTVIQDKVYSDLVINLATLSPLSLQVLSKKVQEEINSFAPNVRTRVVNGMIFLEGTVESADTAARAQKLANFYFPELTPGNSLERDPTVQRPTDRRPRVFSFIVVTPPPPRKQEKLIRVTTRFVELKKDYEKIFGFSWKPMFVNDPEKNTGGGIKVGTGSQDQGGLSFATIIFNLFPKLNSASNAGYARVIKTSNLIVRSGQPAKFDERTNYPVPSINQQTGQVTYSSINVGLTVAVTPLILGQSEDIQLELKLNQSNVVGKAGDIPITADHNVDTKIYVRSTESAAVAGFRGESVNTIFNRDSPDKVEESATQSALFNLSRSKNYRKDRSQFVIFVTPQIIENASDGTDDLKKNFRVKVK